MLRGASYGFFIAGAIGLGFSVYVPNLIYATLVWFFSAGLAVYLANRLRDQ
jgi:hypothetical protein